jgi:hypothetical protein
MACMEIVVTCITKAPITLLDRVKRPPVIEFPPITAPDAIGMCCSGGLSKPLNPCYIYNKVPFASPSAGKISSTVMIRISRSFRLLVVLGLFLALQPGR